MQGWLHKRGPTRSYAWQRRWCVVLPKPARLAYFEDEACQEKRGDIPLDGSAGFYAFTVSYAPGDAAQHRSERPFGFVLEVRVVQGRAPRLFYFDAGEALQLDQWQAALSQACARRSRLAKAVTVDVSRLNAGDEDAYAVEDVEESDAEMELQDDPASLAKGPPPHRRKGASAEAFGAFNERRAAFVRPTHNKLAEHREGLKKALSECPFFRHMTRDAIEDLVDAMPVEEMRPGVPLFRQGDSGSEGYVILSGDADVYDETPSSGSTSPPAHSGAGAKGVFVRTMAAGRFFGEMAMMWSTPRTRSVYARGPLVVGKLEREVYQDLVMRREMQGRVKREECLRRVAMLETLNDEQIAQIADALEEKKYEKGDTVIRQGDEGSEFFVLLAGECVATVTTGSGDHKDVQEVKRYVAGDMFGELAILHKATRKATVTASTTCQVLILRRIKFERMLGSLNQLQQQNYLNDPRKSIADYYRRGDQRGPKGACPPDTPPVGEATDWFAVYRPTSRDAIAKMLNGIAVGKGLNVKGKSAKKNRLSGFVPFLQISNNAHKAPGLIEESPPDARLKIFFPTKEARERAVNHMEPLLRREDLQIDTERKIKEIDSYPSVFGIDLPEVLMRKAYIDDQDISFLIGWETGRQSEPAFMDMNLHAVRGRSKPEVVLYHIDTENPMNPHGLLIAYAEATVKPVVSDFDTFTVGSRGMRYKPLPKEQTDLAKWALENTKHILGDPRAISWNSRWLEVLKKANETGFHPHLPEYGFGDATSYGLIGSVVHAVGDSGAVRHGAECFNFYFPQELDEDYLVVWEDFMKATGKPWKYVNEEDLRDFLKDRIAEGFRFPLNPVWPVRDEGWYEVFNALMEKDAEEGVCAAWYPEDAGIVEIMEEIHVLFPDGFNVAPPDDDANNDPGRIHRSASTYGDLDACEKADLVLCMANVGYGDTWKRMKTRVTTARNFRTAASTTTLGAG